jgi:hypothetical protein
VKDRCCPATKILHNHENDQTRISVFSLFALIFGEWGWPADDSGTTRHDQHNQTVSNAAQAKLISSAGQPDQQDRGNLAAHGTSVEFP